MPLFLSYLYQTLKHTIMMNFKQWIVDLFKDERGSTSVKPVIALLGSLFLSTTMTINSFSHADFAPADNLVDAVLIITAIGMGADTLDKFSSPNRKKKEETTDNTEL